MNTNFDPSKRRNGIAGPEKSVFTQIFTAAIGLLLLVGAFMFSLVFFAIIAVAGALIWGYFLWKTRAIRRQLREQLRAHAEAQKNGQAAGERFGGAFDANDPQFRSAPGGMPPRKEAGSAAASGDVIEGEAVRVDEQKDQKGPQR